MSGLFGNLHEDAFLVFSRQNRHLYAKVILGIYREFYGTFEFHLAPKRSEICDFIARYLFEHQDLWIDEEELEIIPDVVASRGRKRRRRRVNTEQRDPIAMKADHIYARLVNCGWIEEVEELFAIRAEMTLPAQALAERLNEIEGGLEQYLGGVVIEIRNALNAIEARPEENALGLKKAVDSAAGFIRRLRAIHATLVGIRKELRNATDIKGRLRALLEEFVGRVLIQDFKNLMTMNNHPYRFKSDIVGQAGRLMNDAVVLRQVAHGYVANQVAPKQEEAESLVYTHLGNIQEAFESIDAAFGNLNRFRHELELRLNNTVRYMDRINDRTSAALTRAIEAVGRAEYVLARAQKEPLTYYTRLVMTPGRLDKGNNVGRRGSFSVPPAPRARSERQALAIAEKDPAIVALRALTHRWNLLANPSFGRVMEWLDRKVRPGETIDARMLQINDVPEFFAFMKLRMEILHLGAHKDFVFERMAGRREDDWIDTDNFRIRRKQRDAA